MINDRSSSIVQKGRLFMRVHQVVPDRLSSESNMYSMTDPNDHQLVSSRY